MRPNGAAAEVAAVPRDMLRIYNTLNRAKADFVPIKPGTVGMYVCGLTVYDYFHVGNARTLAVFDMVYRWLSSSAHGYKVTYVRNVTDVDDKIIERAAKNGESIQALTARMIAAMHADLDALGLFRPSFEPRATGHIAGMVAMIERLVRNGLAYAAPNGDVYYAVRRFPGYGSLSGKSLDDLRAGQRVDIDTNKEDPLDFVLWKSSKAGEPNWPSPWGPGRPGWHIECSVMSEHHLGARFDIHGGGQDLQFPHHENEIAQSEGAHGHPFVNYWMHVGFLNMANEKMSKSLGNVFRARDVLGALRNPEILRFFLLRGHYRSQLGYSQQNLEDAGGALDTLYTALRGFPSGAPTAVDWAHPLAMRFKEAMDDDFGTPEAFAVLFEVARELNKSKAPALAALLKGLGTTVGLLQQEPDAYLRGIPQSAGLTAEAIEELIAARTAARKAKNFVEADRIRRELDDAGVTLEDGPQGTTWRRA
jgi:cysteinyl-tRNA synthetase